MPRKFPSSALVLAAATAAFGLLPAGCGGPSAPTAEKSKYPPGLDPEVDLLPNTPPPAKKAAP